SRSVSPYATPAGSRCVSGYHRARTSSARSRNAPERSTTRTPASTSAGASSAAAVSGSARNTRSASFLRVSGDSGVTEPLHSRVTVACMKARRQTGLLELIDHEALHSQESLRKRLHQRGFEATQATISRDIKELGLVKRAGDGAYQRPGVEAPNPETALTALERAAAEFLRRVERVQQLVVIRTDAGQAQPLAIALDRAQLPEVVGTIGGDD